jgi:hypothetical protein
MSPRGCNRTRSAIDRSPEPQKQAKSVATHCDQVPIGAHGEEEVDRNPPRRSPRIPSYYLWGQLDPKVTLGDWRRQLRRISRQRDRGENCLQNGLIFREREKHLQIARSRHPDSNRGPLHYTRYVRGAAVGYHERRSPRKDGVRPICPTARFRSLLAN